MTFVIIGGGPTGVELAGAIAELARQTLKNDFRNINPPDARIILVDGQERVLATFPTSLSKKAETSLRRLGIEIQTRKQVTAIRANAVDLKTAEGAETILARTVIWAAGVAGVPLGRAVALACGVEADRGGRVPVQPDLSVAGYPTLFVIGDLASCPGPDGKPLPGVAPVALQEGRYVGKLILGQLRNQSAPAPFKYNDHGSLATIGRKAAVADLGKLKFGGFLAWLLWSLIHVMSIAQFQNRVLVFFQWGWNYITFNRSARLITETHHETSVPAEK